MCIRDRDTSAVTGKPVLAVSNRELLATDYYRKSPKSQKQRVHARRQAGVDEMLSQQGMEQAISVTMTDVDIYENNITLFTNKFVSPLSSLCLLYTSSVPSFPPNRTGRESVWCLFARCLPVMGVRSLCVRTVMG